MKSFGLSAVLRLLIFYLIIVWLCYTASVLTVPYCVHPYGIENVYGLATVLILPIFAMHLVLLRAMVFTLTYVPIVGIE